MAEANNDEVKVYAVVDGQGVVQNIILARPGFELHGMTLIEDADRKASIGGTYSQDDGFMPQASEEQSDG